jgi:hypothetical protein
VQQFYAKSIIALDSSFQDILDNLKGNIKIKTQKQ